MGELLGNIRIVCGPGSVVHWAISELDGAETERRLIGAATATGWWPRTECGR
jgi:hypothetical protein